MKSDPDRLLDHSKIGDVLNAFHPSNPSSFQIFTVLISRIFPRNDGDIFTILSTLISNLSTHLNVESQRQSGLSVEHWIVEQKSILERLTISPATVVINNIVSIIIQDNGEAEL